MRERCCPDAVEEVLPGIPSHGDDLWTDNETRLSFHSMRGWKSTAQEVVSLIYAGR